MQFTVSAARWPRPTCDFPPCADRVRPMCDSRRRRKFSSTSCRRHGLLTFYLFPPLHPFFPPSQVLIAFVLVAAAVASPIAPAENSAEKTAAQSVKDKRAVFGECFSIRLPVCFVRSNDEFCRRVCGRRSVTADIRPRPRGEIHVSISVVVHENPNESPRKNNDINYIT